MDSREMSLLTCEESGPFLDDKSSNNVCENEFKPIKVFGNFYLRKVGNCFVVIDVKRSRIKIVIGPHYPGVIASLISLVMGFVASNMVRKHYGFAFFHFYVSASLAILSCVFLGIILNIANLHALTLIFNTGLVAMADPGIALFSPIVKSDDVNEENTPYCDICEIYQSEYTVHCNTCNCCIEELDHHCPWVGKCIGKKNYGLFKLFMICWIFYLIYFLTLTCIGFYSK